MDDFTVIIRIIGAGILGAIVGFEREWEQKPAGLRTIMLVTIGAAMVMIVAQRTPTYLLIDRSALDALEMDYSRILAALVQGVGFLGAGTIVTGRRTVHGLTTAAGIWAMSAVGSAVGLGDWVMALTGTIACFIVLRVLGTLDIRWEAEKAVDVETDEDENDETTTKAEKRK